MDKTSIIKAGLFLTIIVIILLFSSVYDFERINNPYEVQEIIEKNYILGILLFMAGAVTLKLLFTPVAPITLAGGFLFGGIMGTFISLATLLVVAMIPFYAARYLGAEFVEQILKKYPERIEKYDIFIKKNGLLAIVLFRIVPILPNMVINLGFGLTCIKTNVFFLGTLFGSLPSTYLLANIGENIARPTDPKLHLFLAIYGIFILGVVWWGYRIKRDA